MYSGDSDALLPEDRNDGKTDDEVAEDDEEAVVGTYEPLPPVQLPSTPAKYFLCVDFLGRQDRVGQLAVKCIRTFAEEIARAFVRTQREAVERQVRPQQNLSTFDEHF